jgi:shikimate kinase
VVWITASVATILHRTAADTSTVTRRPKLTAAAGDRAEIEFLLAARAALYRECATFVVDTDGKTAAQVADEIAMHLTEN